MVWKKLMGLMALFCDAGQSLEAAYEHTLKGAYDKCPVIIVSELAYGLENSTLQELKNYVENGGNLVIIGSNTCKIFAENGFGFKSDYYTTPPELPGFANCDVGHDFSTLKTSMPSYFSLFDGKIGSATGASSVIPEGADSKVLGNLYNNVREENGTPFAQIFNFKKGKIAAVGMDLGTHYNESMQYLHRELIKNIVNEMYTPIAKISPFKEIHPYEALAKSQAFFN